MRLLPALLLLFFFAACTNGLESGGAPAGPAPGAGSGASPGPGPGSGSGSSGTELLRVVTVDNDLDGIRELVGISDAGRRLKLAPGLGNVEIAAVAPGGAEIAFGVTADGLYFGKRGKPVRISPTDVLFAVLELMWSPDGAKLAVIAEVDGAPAQLFIVRVDGTGLQALSAATSGVVWTADSTRILFRSDQAIADQNEVYSILCDGTDLVQLTQTAAAPGTFRFVSFDVSPAENLIAFRSDADAVGDFQLYVRDAAGGSAAVRISNAPGTEGTVGWQWRADGAQIAYQRRVTATGFNAVFRVDKDGADEREVSGPRDESVRTYAWANDRIVYRDSDSIHSTDGDTIVDLVTGVAIRTMEVAPDGSHVGYLAGSISRPDLFAVPSDGGPSTLVATEVREFAWEPASALAAVDLPRGRYGLQSGEAFGTFDAAGEILELVLTPPRTSFLVFGDDGRVIARIPMGSADMAMGHVGDRWLPEGLDHIQIANGLQVDRLDDSTAGHSARNIVDGRNATGARFRRDFHAFVDGNDIVIVSVNPQIVAPGTTNFFDGTAKDAAAIQDDDIRGRGFPALGYFTIFEGLFSGGMDFQDGNGTHEFCSEPDWVSEKAVDSTITVRNEPEGTAVVFQATPCRAQLLAIDPTGDWIKVRVFQPTFREQPWAPYTGWVARSNLEANATWRGDLDKLETE